MRDRIRAMMMTVVAALLAVGATRSLGDDLSPLAVGVAGHAFDHLGGIADQADAAAASGANIVYASGFGSIGYGGLPAPAELRAAEEMISAYIRRAKAGGIRLAFGYVCATSIVKLESFDKHWTGEFRAQFSSPPAKWLQLDREGKPLPSWYGGDYRPACMNNPDWRAYQKFIVRHQLESGHDGIFFDNPTVHPKGCYCEHCMRKFARFLTDEKVKIDVPAATESLRRLAADRPGDFMRFRCTIAADFLREIKDYARTIKPDALITCNNSLNSPAAFFSQCRTFAYDIHSMSRVEDLVVIEDMATQPRILADGTAVEYGPVYELLQSISRGKPLVATVLADADYHTPPNLMRLAMAEAAAHGASYLSWPTWPQNVREIMIRAVRPQADFLRENADLLNGTTPRADACLFLPYRRWAQTPDCQALKAARALARANVQFRAVCEADLGNSLTADPPPVLVVESPAVLNDSEREILERYKARGGQVVWSEPEEWLAELRRKVERPVVTLTAAPTIRAVVREKTAGTIVHLLNLNVRRLSSFEDRITPVARLGLKVRCRADRVTSVKALTADPDATRGGLPFKAVRDGEEMVVDATVPRVDLSTILVIE
jgi:hypothetical protein